MYSQKLVILLTFEIGVFSPSVKRASTEQHWQHVEANQQEPGVDGGEDLEVFVRVNHGVPPVKGQRSFMQNDRTKDWILSFSKNNIYCKCKHQRSLGDLETPVGNKKISLPSM